MNHKVSIYLLICIIAGLSILAFFANERRSAIIDTPVEEGMPVYTYLYRFEDFPAEKYVGTASEVDFSTNPYASRFKTSITEAVSRGVNFAGRYIITEWGCGTACQGHAIIDGATGRVVYFGLPSAYSIEFYPESRLLIVNSPRTLAELSTDIRIPDMTSDYYEIRDGQLIFLAKQSEGEKSSTLCAQVVTSAQSPFTDEKREFGSPCLVPYGWSVSK